MLAGFVIATQPQSRAGARSYHHRCKAMLAMDLIPAIRARLTELERHGRDPLAGGQRAALWRAQQHAAHVHRSVDDLRRYCLEALRPRLLDEADENDYLRGFRQGFQTVLREIRLAETGQAPRLRAQGRGGAASS